MDLSHWLIDAVEFYFRFDVDLLKENIETEEMNYEEIFTIINAAQSRLYHAKEEIDSAINERQELRNKYAAETLHTKRR